MRKTFLIISQTFVPDPAAVGQHIADAAFQMARRGHRVLVYTANRGYDDPTVVYPEHEFLKGIEIRRLKLSSFGKKSLLTRIIGTASFTLQCVWLVLTMPNLSGILFSTSPPMIGVAASLARIFRGVPVIYWAMDLNPDQLIAMGKIPPGGFAARLLESVNRFILRNASLVVALDRFMADRLGPRANLDGKLEVIAPWPLETISEPIEHGQNPFRQRHDLGGKFVVMYSGNHSTANPLETVLLAAEQLRDDPDIRFLFVGGGIGKKDVERFIAEHRLGNAISLPYQPLAELRYSLSAADVHVVSLGDNMVGIIHPCKIYGAMAVARPVLFVGPRPSHISDLLQRYEFGAQVAHGDVETAVREIRRLRGSPTLRQMGRLGQQVLNSGLSQAALCCRFCNCVETAIRFRPAITGHF